MAFSRPASRETTDIVIMAKITITDKVGRGAV